MWKQELADNCSISMLNREHIFQKCYLIIFKLLTQKIYIWDVCILQTFAMSAYSLSFYNATVCDLKMKTAPWEICAVSQTFWLSSLLTPPFSKACFAKFTVIEHVSSVSVSHIIMEIYYLLHHNEKKIHLKLFKKTGFFGSTVCPNAWQNLLILAVNFSSILTSKNLHKSWFINNDF